MKNHLGGNATEFQNTYTNRSPLGRYFFLPNEIFTLGLSPGELSVYAYLIFCEDRKTHRCWPSIGRISQHTGMSTNTVAKYIRQLEEKQLIDVEPTKVRTKSGKVRNGTLRFTICPIQEAINYKLERDLAALPNPKHTKEKTLKPKLDPVRACVRFLSRDRETIPAKRVTRLVGGVWGSCGRIEGQRRIQMREN